MKKSSFFIIKFLISLLFFLIPYNAFAETASTTPEPYDTEEFPQSLKDLRRFEIITLGSMPFITLDSTIAYSGFKAIKDGTTFNPFSTSSYSQEEQKNLILTSLAISSAIGMYDYIFHLIKRSTANKKNKQEKDSYINVVPISEDPDAIKIDLDSEEEIPATEYEEDLYDSDTITSDETSDSMEMENLQEDNDFTEASINNEVLE